jgi:hypothetical protein
VEIDGRAKVKTDPREKRCKCAKIVIDGIKRSSGIKEAEI